jgi:RNA polymerase-associated protein CTR9
MLVSLKTFCSTGILIVDSLGQDIMTKEKPKEEYYREAAQFLNTGERVGADSGEGVGGTLAFLTRGKG